VGTEQLPLSLRLNRHSVHFPIHGSLISIAMLPSSSPIGRFSGAVGLVTGAGRGIGRAMALRLAEEGADVVGADIDVNFANETASMIREFGRKVLTVEVNVAVRDEVNQLVERSIAHMGTIDILMNNAGVMQCQEMLTITESDWDFVCGVNLKGAF